MGQRDQRQRDADGPPPPPSSAQLEKFHALFGKRALAFVPAAPAGSWRAGGRDCVLVTCSEDPELGKS